MSYSILLFDADRTLLDFDKSEELAFFETVPLFGIKPTEQNLDIYKRCNKANWEALEKGLISKPRLLVKRFEDFLTEIGMPIFSASEMHEKYTQILSQKSILLDGALDMIKTLHQHGKRLFVITNGVTAVQKGRLFPSPIFPYLENVFISESMGVSKPQKLFFDLIQKQIPNFNASECIVIGDSLTSDIQGANNAGLDCMWLNVDNDPKPDNLRIDYQVFNFTQMQQILLK